MVENELFVFGFYDSAGDNVLTLFKLGDGGPHVTP